MRIKNLNSIAAISILIIAGGIIGFLMIHKNPGIPHHVRQDLPAAPDNAASGSIPKTTFLVLLAAGAIGALSVRRKRNPETNTARQKTPQSMADDRGRAFIELNKQYLNLQYRITQHKFSGDFPPDGLKEEITNIERKVRLISRALQ
jgi:hypothetical protein